MNRTRLVFRHLLLLPGVFVLVGCAERVSEETVASAPTSAADATEPAATNAPAEPEPATEPSSTDEPETPDGEQSGVEAVDSDSDTPSETTEPAEAGVGSAAPDFVATGLDGELTSFSEYLGEQNVVLAFSRANW